jgi:hypothetical protein
VVLLSRVGQCLVPSRFQVYKCVTTSATCKS